MSAQSPPREDECIQVGESVSTVVLCMYRFARSHDDVSLSGICQTIYQVGLPANQASSSQGGLTIN